MSKRKVRQLYHGISAEEIAEAALARGHDTLAKHAEALTGRYFCGEDSSGCR